MPVYQWQNGTEVLYVGEEDDAILCMELSSESRVANYALVKQNNYKANLRAILREETKFLNGSSFGLATTEKVANASRIEFEEVYLKNVIENGDKKAKASAKAAQAALGKVVFCSEDYNCTRLDSKGKDCAPWERCRCSGDATYDTTDCVCDEGLTVCNKVRLSRSEPVEK